MSRILIKGGRLIDPASGIDGLMDVLIEGDKIAAVEANISADGARVINAKGLIVSPGFIDLHVHFREPGQEYKETIETGALSAVAGGFTSVCCMANTTPANDNGTVTSLIVEKAREAGLARVYPVGAVSKNLDGRELAEIGEMKKAGAVALSDDGRCVLNPRLIRSAMEYGSMFGLTVVEHCEDDSAKGGAINEGEVSARFGIQGMPATAEDSIAVRNIVISEYTSLPVHIAHISTKGAVEAVRAAKKKGIQVTCEVTPHHFTLTEKELENFDPDFKMNPPLRSEEDVRAIKEGLKDGAIDCIATDHAPHAAWEKEMEIDKAPFGVVGLETALGLSLKLVEEGVISLPEMISLLTNRPAGIFNLPGGTLKKGAPADIAVFDPEREWKVEPDEFFSKGKNSPFKGWTLKGKNLLTVVGGRIVFNPEEL
jgi:dihydroorotase